MLGPTDHKSGVKCNVYTCPRNESGECELSRIYPTDHEYYTEPSKCQHYKFKHRNDEL